MRKFEILIDGKKFIEPHNVRQFRISFTSRVRYSDKLGFLDLAIYNLSRETSIPQGKQIVLQAGYDDEFDQIFSGTIITVLKEREGPNIITRVLCRSGSVYERPSIQVSLGQNSTALQALEEVAKTWNVRLNIDQEQFADAPVLIRGYAMNGDLTSVLNSLGGMFDFHWIETADGIIIDRYKKPTKGTPREVSLFTGLIGVPEAEGDVQGYFVNLTLRMSPRIRLRTLIDLKSEYASYSTGNFYITPPENGGQLSGVYKVIEVVHRGDSWGERWQSELRCQSNEVLKDAAK